MRVLVVEDEEVMAEAVATLLRRVGHAVDVAHDGEAGLERARLHSYDVVVLDRDLPVVHGDDVCRALAVNGVSRVLLLTASATVNDRVDGLRLGADDYLVKPFEPAELLARVDALGRRTVRATPPVYQLGDLVVDIGARRAVRAGHDLGLSLKEFGVLEVLACAGGRLVSAEELIDRVWDENTDPFSGIVRVVMVSLRRKLGDPGIETVRGAGYRLIARATR